MPISVWWVEIRPGKEGLLKMGLGKVEWVGRQMGKMFSVKGVRVDHWVW